MDTNTSWKDKSRRITDLEAEVAALTAERDAAQDRVAELEEECLSRAFDAAHLRAQLAQQWLPLGPHEYVECDDGSIKTSDEEIGYFLFVTGEDGDMVRRSAVVELPPTLRLCRRTTPAE